MIMKTKKESNILFNDPQVILNGIKSCIGLKNAIMEIFPNLQLEVVQSANGNVHLFWVYEKESSLYKYIIQTPGIAYINVEKFKGLLTYIKCNENEQGK